MSPSIQDCVEVINTHEGHSKRTYEQNKVEENNKNQIEKIWLENLPEKDKNKIKNKNKIENLKEKEEEKENKGIIDRDRMRMKGPRQECEQVQEIDNADDNHLKNNRTCIQQAKKQIKQIIEIKNKFNGSELKQQEIGRAHV